MSVEESGPTSLRVVTFEELYHSGRLPSGHTFELVPDTLGNSLKVSEIDEKVPWRKKAAEAGVIAASVSSQDVQAMKPKDRIPFMGGMLDTDIMFLSMAWGSQTNGMTIKIDPKAGVVCPTCGNKFESIPYGGIPVYVRDTPVGGPDAVWPVSVDHNLLPESLRSQSLMLVDPTWMPARQHIPNGSWDDPTVVKINRVGASLRVKSGDGPPRVLSRAAEFERLRNGAINQVSLEMDKRIPHFAEHFDYECSHCGVVAVIPFELGL